MCLKYLRNVCFSDNYKKREIYDKYSAEEKVVEEISDEEDFNKSVTERRQQIEKRLSIDRAIPASSQRVEIVQEISSIKGQSLVEDKIMEAEQKTTQEIPKSISSTDSKAADVLKTTLPSDVQRLESTKPTETTTKITTIVTETRTDLKPDTDKLIYNTNEITNERRDSELLEGVTHILETKKPISKIIATEGKYEHLMTQYIYNINVVNAFYP